MKSFKKYNASSIVCLFRRCIFKVTNCKVLGLTFLLLEAPSNQIIANGVVLLIVGITDCTVDRRRLCKSEVNGCISINFT